ncbi:UbiE/COQ5 methyltransferase [Rickenella mellea]|uniref:2-methoxy-6-polyprenyl-1,4-benzoquinol methylase, mitochondrial n=1 Tax=Rickenella mellea TaxID=50990 RepID=A0A4Y7Q7E6_9AGAM|nr:UbiE/COQ5 methyltransferase [Rickenella mellea]
MRPTTRVLRLQRAQPLYLAHRRHAHTTPHTNVTTEAEKTTHFGFRTVPETSKETLVKDVFNSVASKYDLMNDAMSFGVHRLWKDTFVSLLKPGKSGAIRCLDVAGGTGDIALRILDYAKDNYADRETSVEVLDINSEMLKEGYKRFKKTMYHKSARIVSFIEGNAQKLELPPSTYDLYTIAFGIRNCTSIPDVLKEAHRVLKPGGTFACLEFSKVDNPILATIYENYSFSIIPLLGTILASDRASYQYLVESIRRFPPQSQFGQMIRDAGFETGGDFEGEGGAWRDLWGGVASIHTGVKI